MKTIALAAALILSAWAIQAHGASSPNDQARFLAGLPLAPESPLYPLTQTEDWKRHATELDQMWARLENRSLARTRQWAQTFLTAGTRGAPCYYFFSGPDILYAHSIFPTAPTYVLCGIEPVGFVPDLATLPPEKIGPALAGLRRSISNVVRFSYFITKEMREDLGMGELGGTAPVMYLFLARSGCQISKVNSASGAKSTGSITIEFTSAYGSHRAIYFKADLANGGSGDIVKNYCRQQSTSGVALLKAASYLMHGEGFSQTREFLLTHCRTIVQDDSGIPFHHFTPDHWQLRLFGQYTGTTGGIFAKYFQADLQDAYARTQTTPLSFQISYQYDPRTANLLIATRTAARAKKVSR